MGLIGVLCEAINAVAAEEKEQMLTSTVMDKMSSILKTLDHDGSGKISLKEFKAILHIPEALNALKQVDVDPVGIVDFAEMFFFEDGEPVDLDFHQFMAMVPDLRGCNTAKVKDLLNTSRQITTKF